MAWYNKYRPTKFEDVIAQDLVKSVLQNAVSKQKVKHAYLLTGPKGVGKTTLARIFAASLNETDKNQQASIDIIELDAASNTGIDNIRQLIESAQNPPLSGKYKVYIIDEVHMLSKAAMNALLKILEEPPQYLVFLLATTNPEKILPTVLSRLTVLHLSAHTNSDISQKLENISLQEGLKIDKESLDLIAKRASGSQRDAINLLETIASYELDSYSFEQTAKLLGLLPAQVLRQTAQKLMDGTLDKNFLLDLEKTETDAESFLAQLLDFLVDLSFSSDQKMNSLILPVAEVLDLNLPFGSLVTVMAVLQQKLLQNNSQFVFDSSKKVDVNPQPAEKKSPKVKSQAAESNSEKTEEIANQREIKESLPVQNKKDLSENIATGTADFAGFDLSQINQVFWQMKSDSNCPPIVKMLGNDIRADKIEENQLFLSVSSGLFLAQLKSPKIQEYLCKVIQEKLKLIIKIQASLRNQKSSFTVASEQTKAGVAIENINKNLDLKLDTNFIAAHSQSESPEVEKTKDGKPFYKIYKTLPENVDKEKVEIIESPLKKPVKHDEHWEKELEDFDFE